MTSRILLMMGAAVLLGTVGCRSNASYAVERRHPAPVALPEVGRLGVVAFVGSAGDQLAAAARSRLGQDSAFSVQTAGSAATDDPAALAALARDRRLDGVLAGRVVLLEVGRTLEAPTLVTKNVAEGPKDLPTKRLLKTGRLQATFSVVLADGRVRRGRAVVADVRAERIEDPDPHATTLFPRELPQDPIPTDEQVVAQLLEIGAAAIAHEILPRREPALVTWESAGGVDDDARREFEQRDYRVAADRLAALLGERRAVERPADGSSDVHPATGLAPSERAALLYDLGLCEDLLGDHLRADRHLDQALALANTELHQAALRDLRRRAEMIGREERR